MQSSTERDLLEKSKGGDDQAFRKLVEAHQGFAYAVAYRFVGEQGEAEDITQEAFIKLWRTLGSYRAGTKLSTWLYKIIMNGCLDYLKSTRRKRQLLQVDTDSNHLIADETQGERNQEDREMLAIIVNLAQQLTPKQQSVFVLRDLEALPVEEVCEITAMDAGQVKSNLYYARIAIREGLKENYREAIKPKS